MKTALLALGTLAAMLSATWIAMSCPWIGLPLLTFTLFLLNDDNY